MSNYARLLFNILMSFFFSLLRNEYNGGAGNLVQEMLKLRSLFVFPMRVLTSKKINKSLA